MTHHPQPPSARVLAVSHDNEHSFSKAPAERITLVADWGVVGDAHAGTTVQHRSRVAKDPTQPNLRQIHLIHSELLDELRQSGFDVPPGGLGENITTVGLNVLGLPRGARVHIGETAVVEVTGLRNPCSQINDFMPGLLKQVMRRGSDGSVERRTGVMGVVALGGDVFPGDTISVVLPDAPHKPLRPV